MEIIKQCYELGLIALIPIYKDMRGDYTKILTGNLKEYYIAKNIRTVINILARYKLIDLNQSRKYYGNKLGCKNLIPIPLDKETILTPIKLRKASCKSDSTFGYINVKYIKDIEERNGVCVVNLKGNIKLETLQKTETVEKHIRNGNLVESIYKNRNIKSSRQYTELATKEDIEALKSDIIYFIRENMY